MGVIDSELAEAFLSPLGRRTASNEVASWNNLLFLMGWVIRDCEIPDNVDITIEFQIPLFFNRIDFIINVLADQSQENVVIVELNQRTECEKTDCDAIVKGIE